LPLDGDAMTKPESQEIRLILTVFFRIDAIRLTTKVTNVMMAAGNQTLFPSNHPIHAQHAATYTIQYVTAVLMMAISMKRTNRDNAINSLFISRA